LLKSKNNNNNPIEYKDIYKDLYQKIFPQEQIFFQQDVIFFLQKVLEYIKIHIFNFTLIQKRSNNTFYKNMNQILILYELDKNGKRIEPSTLQDIININTKLNNNRSSVNIKNEINKYIIIYINRGGNEYSSRTNQDIVINNEITINNKKYFLIGSIIKIGDQSSGHYIYVTFYLDGKIYKVYDDSIVSDPIVNDKEYSSNNIPLSKLLLNSSIIFLFKKFDDNGVKS
jgi:hypothetical protein